MSKAMGNPGLHNRPGCSSTCWPLEQLHTGLDKVWEKTKKQVTENEKRYEKAQGQKKSLASVSGTDRLIFAREALEFFKSEPHYPVPPRDEEDVKACQEAERHLDSIL